MPTVEIVVTGPDSRARRTSLVAQVDSGADVTMLPREILRQANARYLVTRSMRGVTGHRMSVDTYLVSIQIGPHRIMGIQAVSMLEGAEAIIGRDVLNQLEITLHGPAQELWVA